MPFRNMAQLCLLSLLAAHAGAQTIGGCPVFPANNIWNARIDTQPVHGRSAAWVNAIGPSATLHQDFLGFLINGVEPGMPITLVNGSQPKVPIVFNPGAEESDPGPYPIPPTAKVEPGDRHVIVVDTTNCLLYETYDSVKNADNSWNAYSGAIFDLRKNLLRPLGWTSSDAAGLPIMPGLARYEEILEGEIKHALRFTAPRTVREFLWPARHFASSSTDVNLPPMGARFRLKADFNISSFSPTTQIILTALKRYGMMLADNGSSWYVQGTYDTRWPDMAEEWRRIPGSAFEAIDVSGLMESVDSAAVRGSATTAPALLSVALTPSAVTGGQNSTLRVNLTGPAIAGGAQVSLSSSNPAVAPAAPQVMIPEGSSFAELPVTTSAVAVQTNAIFTATLAGLTRQATLTVSAPAPALQSAAFLAATATGGQPATLRVSLSAPAAAGGATITLLSATPAVASIQGSVQIPSGGSTADVPVSTVVVQSQTAVQFTATMGAVSKLATLSVNPPAGAAALSSASLTIPSVIGGSGTMLVITLTQAAPAGGFTVALTSANSSVANLQPSVTIGSGSTSVQVPVTTFAVSAQTQIVLSASAAGVSRQAGLTVLPPSVSGLQVNPSSVQGGAGATGTVTLNAKAPAGGFTVSLSSANTAAATVPSSVQVGAGQTSGTFPVTTKTVTANTSAQLTASAQGVSATANLGVTAAPATAVTLSGVSAQLLPQANRTKLRLTVTLSGPAGSSGALVVLAGNNPAVVNLSGQQIRVKAKATSAMADFDVVSPSSADVTLAISATLGTTTKTTSITIPKVVVAVSAIRMFGYAPAGQWSYAIVELTDPASSNEFPVVVTTSGVVDQVRWVSGIERGRSRLTLGFHTFGKGAGTISASYGGVTKTNSVTAF